MAALPAVAGEPPDTADGDGDEEGIEPPVGDEAVAPRLAGPDLSADSPAQDEPAPPSPSPVESVPVVPPAATFSFLPQPSLAPEEAPPASKPPDTADPGPSDR